jgi:hypothetical protein
MSYKLPIHLLIRFSNSLLKDKDTIEEHNNIVHQYGSVWFGKMGSPVSQGIIDILNNQVSQGISTFIYLVKGNRRKSTAYRSRLIFATRIFPENEKNLIPTYYSDLKIPQYVNFWVKLDFIDHIEFIDMNKMKVVSSVLPLSETLTKSQTGHFIIQERNS